MDTQLIYADIIIKLVINQRNLKTKSFVDLNSFPNLIILEICTKKHYG